MRGKRGFWGASKRSLGASSRPVYQFYFFLVKPVPTKVERFLQRRGSVLQPNQGPNRNLPFRVSDSGGTGFVRESCVAGIFLPGVFSANRRRKNTRVLGLGGIGKKKQFYLPVCKHNHWILLVVNMREKQFIVLDSMPSIFHHHGGYDEVMEHVLIWVGAIYAAEGINEAPTKDDWVLIEEFAPEEENGWEYGVFVMRFTEDWDGHFSENFQVGSPNEMRIKYALQLIQSNYNIRLKHILECQPHLKQLWDKKVMVGPRVG